MKHKVEVYKMHSGEWAWNVQDEDENEEFAQGVAPSEAMGFRCAFAVCDALEGKAR